MILIASLSSASAVVEAGIQCHASETAHLLSPDGAEDELFGCSVAVSGDRLVIGAAGHWSGSTRDGAVYVLRREGHDWVVEEKRTGANHLDWFGTAVAICDNHMVVGAEGADVGDSENAGRVYVYEYYDDDWHQTGWLAPSVPWHDARFGAAVAVRGDLFVVGAPQHFGSGSAFVYRYDGSEWAEEAEIEGSDSNWSDWVGGAVATDGQRVLIGARDADNDDDVRTGAAYVFRFDGSEWIEEAKLLARDGAAGDFFGCAVGISGDHLIVGARYADHLGPGTGAAYLYRYNGSEWVEDGQFFSSYPESGLAFGSSVAMDGNYVIVGASRNGYNGFNTGTAYLFHHNGWTWNKQAFLYASSGGSDDYLGDSVAIFGDIAVAGAAYDDDQGVDSGSAYLFLGIDDCNTNGQLDLCDIANGVSNDLNYSGIPDECEPDCNDNGLPDDLDIDEGISEDCNVNAVPDECDIADGVSQDCNANGSPDECDLDSGLSEDCNLNDIPDECDIDFGWSEDCNGNAIPDECDLDSGVSDDCNLNGIPDECDVYSGSSPDCNDNDIPDECDIDSGFSVDCNLNGVPDDCDIAGGDSGDCNGNGIPDECDIAEGVSDDINGNGVPDECEIDCNENGYPDDWDIDAGLSYDCNTNGVPDECDITDGTSQDCNANGNPDECDLSDGLSDDCNDNLIPDECDVLAQVGGTSGPLSPFGIGHPQAYTLLSPAPSHTDVKLIFTAMADLSKPYTEYVDVYVNGVDMGRIFVDDGHDCPDEPDVDEIVIAMNDFNDLVDGADLLIEMLPFLEVNPYECVDPTYIDVEVRYFVPSDHDHNWNGIPDECECLADVNSDGQVDGEDIVAAMGGWGSCDDPAECPGDVTIDGTVDIDDIFAILAAWGPCT